MDNNQKWQLRREISIGDVTAIVSAFIAILYSYTTLDKRLTVVENSYQMSLATQKQKDEEQDQNIIRTRNRIDENLKNISEKLDWIIKEQITRRR